MVRGGGPAEMGYKTVVIVSSNKSHAENDRAVLNKFPLKLLKVCDTADCAFKVLTASPCDIILCDSQIKGMDSKTFLKTVKNNPRLKHIPVVMVTLENDRNAVLDAVAAGCSGYILRPYSFETFEKHMDTALQLVRFSEIETRQLKDAKLMLEMGDFDDAIEEFEEVVSMQGEAQKYYDLGCSYLAREKFGKAIVAFQKAVKMNDLFAEAYQGLSEAYRGRGDLEQCQFFLKKAAEIYAEFDRMEKVKEIFIDILKFDNAAPNPFNTLGVRLRKSGDYQGAIKAYQQALELTPSDENIYFNMAKAFIFMDDDKSALERVAMALRINGDFPEALMVYKKLKGAAWPGAKTVVRNGRPASQKGPTIKDV